MKKVLISLLVVIMLATGVFALNYNSNNTEPSFNQTASATKTANYTATASDSLINVNTTSNAVTITLPQISTLSASGYSSKSFKILKTDSTPNIVTVSPASGDTIDGTTAYVVTKQNDFVILESESHGNWKVSYADDLFDCNVTSGVCTAGRGVVSYGGSAFSGSSRVLVNATSGVTQSTSTALIVAGSSITIPAGYASTSNMIVTWTLAGHATGSSNKTIAVVTSNNDGPVATTTAYNSRGGKFGSVCKLFLEASSTAKTYCQKISCKTVFDALDSTASSTNSVNIATSTTNLAGGGTAYIKIAGANGTGTTTVEYIEVEYME